MRRKQYNNFMDVAVDIAKWMTGTLVAGVVFIGSTLWLFWQAYQVDPRLTTVASVMIACVVSGFMLILLVFQPDYRPPKNGD